MKTGLINISQKTFTALFVFRQV